MKRFLFISFIVIMTVVGVFFAQGQNYLTLSYGEWAVQIQLWVIIFGLLALVIIYTFLSAILRWLSRLPSRWSHYWQGRHEQQKREQDQSHQETLNKINSAIDIAELKRYWQSLSASSRHEPGCAAAYVRAALRLGEEATVSDIIEWQLAREWQNDFVTYYGLLLQNPEKRLKNLNQWMIQHPHNAYLLLACGRLSKQAEQWGKAEQYFQQCISLHPSVAAYLELASVQQQLNKPELAWRSYQAASQMQRAAEIAE